MTRLTLLATHTLTSPKHPLITRLASLQQQLQRLKPLEKPKSVLVEGRKPILQLLQANKWPLLNLLLREDIYETESSLHPTESTVIPIESQLFTKLTSTSNPSGYLAEFALPRRDRSLTLCSTCSSINPYTSLEADQLSTGQICWSRGGVILDSIRDPANLGTIIRSCVAFGVKQLLLIDCCSLFNPKSIQSSVGTLSQITVGSYAKESFLREWSLVKSKINVSVTALMPHRSITTKSTALKEPLDVNHPHCAFCPLSYNEELNQFLVVGNETHGISQEIQEIATHTYCIPMRKDVENLNAAVALSIVMEKLYEKKIKNSTIEPI